MTADQQHRLREKVPVGTKSSGGFLRGVADSWSKADKRTSRPADLEIVPGQEVDWMLPSPRASEPRAIDRLERESRLRTTGWIVGGVAALAIGHALLLFLADLPVFTVQANGIVVRGLPDTLTQSVTTRVMEAMQHPRSIFSVSTTDIRNTLLTDSRLGDIKVTRKYPDQIVIEANERHPAAIGTSDAGFFVLDRAGRVLSQADGPILANLDLPFISGIPAEDLRVGKRLNRRIDLSALRMLRYLQETTPDIYAQVAEVHLGRDAVSQLDLMSLHFLGGMEVKVGNREPQEVATKLRTYLDAFIAAGGSTLDIAYLDLRVPEQVVVMRRTVAMAQSAQLDTERLLEEATTTTTKIAGPAESRRSGPMPSRFPTPAPAAAATVSAPSQPAANKPARSFYDLSSKPQTAFAPKSR